MNPERLTDERVGKIIPISIGGPDWAFVPQPLPRQWDVPRNLFPLLASAHRELGRLDGSGRTLPNPESLLRPLQSREAIRSSSLEGTDASAEEFLLFELEPTQPASVDDRVHEWREVLNYAAALRRGTELLETLPEDTP